MGESEDRDQQILGCKGNCDFILILDQSLWLAISCLEQSFSKDFYRSNTAAVVCDEMLFIDQRKFVIGYIHEEMSFPSNKIGAVGR